MPLFPLQAVLFPGGQLTLKVFETRYLDLVGRCLREGAPFVVVCLRRGAEVGAGRVAIEDVGVQAHIDRVDAEQAGILHLRCHGGERVAIDGEPTQQDDGLWCAPVEPLPADPHLVPEAAMLGTVRALAEAIRNLRAQGQLPFGEPFRLDDSGWVANRWCELLPISLAARQRLMALPAPDVRLRLVDEYLRGKGVVEGS